LATCVTGEGRAMAQTVSRRPLTSEARFRVQVSPRGFCGEEGVTGQVFSPSFSVFFLLVIIQPLLHTYPSPLHEVWDCSYQSEH
jgi:hypothetical protein